MALLLTLTLCVSVFMIGASAESTGLVSLKIAGAETESETDTGVNNWYLNTNDGKYYLFLPASYDRTALKVWFTASGTVTAGDQELVSGEITDVFASDSVTLSCSDSQYQVVVMDGAQTGAVYINTESGSIDAVHADKEHKEPGTVRVLDEDGSVLYDGALDYIKGRGNSTWNGAKKPYNIKLNKKADLFGMGKSKKWCLLANASDATLMRNHISYWFAKSIGVDVTSDVVPVALYIDGNFMGAYSVTEKVEIGENRVDITDLEKLTEAVNTKELDQYSLGGDQRTLEKGTYQYVNIPNNPEDISGGYLLELEKVYRYINEDSGFISNRGQAIVMKSPEEASKAQVEYMRDYYQQFEDALYSYDGYNAEGMYYTDYLDAESVARMYIAEEFTQNFDGCSSSFFLYKDVDGIITAGPAWDFDLTFSSNSRMNELINKTTPIGDPTSLYIQNCFIDNYDESHKAFLAQLFTHEDFQLTVQRIWNETVNALYPQFVEQIDAYSQKNLSLARMNAIRWNTYRTVNASSIDSSYLSRVNDLKKTADARYSFLAGAYAQDSLFVKYELGEYGEKLIFDTGVYHAGDTVTVANAPVPKANEKHFLYYTTTPDGSGTHYAAGDKVTLAGNTTFYAKWEDHTTAHTDYGTDTCTVCGVTFLNGELIADGWFGERYYKNNVALTGFQTLAAPDGSGTFLYQIDDNGNSEGKFSGIYNGYYYVDGVLTKNAGVIDYQGDYYYIGMRGQVYTGAKLNLSSSVTNGLLAAGTYQFRSDGTIILKEGIIDGYYYERGTVVKGKGVIDYQGDYYYIGQKGQVYTGSSLYLNAAMTNGLLAAGTYQFRSDGTIILKEGIIDGYYYERGTVVKGKGVIDYQGDYYYIGQKGQVFTGNSLYLNAAMTNGLLAAGTYQFRSDGTIILKEGIIDGYYYERGTVVKGKGVIDYQGNYYYIGQKGQVYANGTLFLSASVTNGLIPAGKYTFDKNGVIVM